MRMIPACIRTLAGAVLALALTAAPAPAAPDKDNSVNPVEKLRKDLDKTITVKIDKQSLSTAVEALRKQTNINFILDSLTIQQQLGFSPDAPPSPVEVDLKDVKVRAALRTVLAPYNLSFAPVGDAVVITTEDVAMLRQMRQRISVDFDKVEFAVALKQIARGTGVNLVLDGRVGKEAAAKMSLQMEDAPLETVVRLLAEMANLKPVRVGNVLFVTGKANANEMRQDPDNATPNPERRRPAGAPPARRRAAGGRRPRGRRRRPARRGAGRAAHRHRQGRVVQRHPQVNSVMFSSRLPLAGVIELCRVLRHYLGAGLTLSDVFRQQAATGRGDVPPRRRPHLRRAGTGRRPRRRPEKAGRRLPAAAGRPRQRRRTDRHVAGSLHRTGKILRPPAAVAAAVPRPDGLAALPVLRRRLRDGRRDLRVRPDPAGVGAVRAALRPARPGPVRAGRGAGLPGVGVRLLLLSRGAVPRRDAPAAAAGGRGRLPAADAGPRPVPASTGVGAVLPGAAADAGDGDADRAGRCG